MNRIKKNGSRFLGKCGEGLWYVMKDKDARRLFRVRYQPDSERNMEQLIHMFLTFLSTSREQMELMKIGTFDVAHKREGFSGMVPPHVMRHINNHMTV